MDLGLKGKVALVTGASKGLGRAIAEELAQEGADVSICARGEKELTAVADAIRHFSVPVHARPADVAKASDVIAFIDGAMKALGRVDILVNNAGDAWISHMLDTSDDDWRYSSTST